MNHDNRAKGGGSAACRRILGRVRHSTIIISRLLINCNNSSLSLFRAFSQVVGKVVGDMTISAMKITPVSSDFDMVSFFSLKCRHNITFIYTFVSRIYTNHLLSCPMVLTETCLCDKKKWCR